MPDGLAVATSFSVVIALEAPEVEPHTYMQTYIRSVVHSFIGVAIRWSSWFLAGGRPRHVPVVCLVAYICLRRSGHCSLHPVFGKVAANTTTTITTTTTSKVTVITTSHIAG